MTQKRRQLTLFIDSTQSDLIEKIRRAHNPVQHALIDAHVTLCREDEIEEIEEVMRNLDRLNHGVVEVNFGKILRFSEGKGVMMPAIGSNDAFHGLRAAILKGIVEKPRMHEPHITLMHPRNSTCTDAIFEQLEVFEFPETITFGKISLIEQALGMRWVVLKEFYLFS